MPDIPDQILSESVRKFVEEMDRVNKGLREAICQVVLPDVSPLMRMVDGLAVSVPAFGEIVQQAILEPSKWEIFAKESEFPVVGSQLQEEVSEILKHAADVMRECEAGAERLAESGWTMPVHMSPGEMLRVLKKTAQDEIDQEFVAFYEDGGELQRLRDTLIRSPRLKIWSALLNQCFESYEERRHLICIPALLSVLEGAVALPERAAFVRVKDRIDFFDAKMKASHKGSLEELMWKTLNRFFARLYETSDFATGLVPSRLNRHWILHGRDVPDQWRPTDALRLFHALSTICSVFD